MSDQNTNPLRRLAELQSQCGPENAIAVTCRYWSRLPTMLQSQCGPENAIASQRQIEQWKAANKAFLDAVLDTDFAALADLPERLIAAEALIEELRLALCELVDWQNGPPLPSYKSGWNKAMDEAHRLLEGWMPK